MTKKSKFFIIITVFALSFSLFNSDLQASFNKFKVKDIDVQVETDSIQINWKDIGDSYVIEVNGEEYTETPEESVHLTDLEPGNPYEVAIKAKSKENISDIFVVQTLTKRTEQETSNSEYILEPAITTAIVKDDQVKIIFEDLPEQNMNYVVTKNDTEFGKLKGKKPFIIDTDLEANEKYRYALIGAQKLDFNERREAVKSLKENKISKEMLDIDDIEKEFELARTVKTLNSKKANQAHAENWYSYGVGAEFVYTTFIKPHNATFVPFLVGGSVKYHKFKGDGRNFDRHAVSPKYRTKTWVRVTFPDSGGSKVRFRKYINPTTGQHNTTKEWVTKAPAVKNNKVYLKNKQESSTKAVFTVYHDAKNSLHDMDFEAFKVSSPGITYQYRGEVYKNGYFNIVGYHDRAPHHEMSYSPVPGEIHTYNGKVTYSTWTHLFTDEIGSKAGFYNLVGPPIYPQKAISEQGYWNWNEF